MLGECCVGWKFKFPWHDFLATIQNFLTISEEISGFGAKNRKANEFSTETISDSLNKHFWKFSEFIF